MSSHIYNIDNIWTYGAHARTHDPRNGHFARAQLIIAIARCARGRRPTCHSVKYATRYDNTKKSKLCEHIKTAVHNRPRFGGGGWVGGEGGGWGWEGVIMAMIMITGAHSCLPVKP